MINIISNTVLIPYSLRTTILAYVITLIVLYIFVYKWRYREYYKKLEQFPSFPSFPIIGGLHLIVGSIEGRVEKFLHLLDNYRYKSPIIFWFSFKPVICIMKHEDIQIVSNKSIYRYTLGLLENELDENGIMLSPPQKWRKTRHLMNPAFTMKMLEQYLKAFCEESKLMVQNMRVECNTEKIFNVNPYIIMTSLNAVVANLCGVNTRNDENQKFTAAVNEYLMLNLTRFTRPWLAPGPIFKMYLRLIGKNELRDLMTKFISNIIQKRIEELNKISADPNIENSDRSVKTLLDILLNAKETNPEIDEKYLQSEVLTMIGTGYETMTTVACFLTLMLAIHQDAQEKAYQEIKSVFKDLNKPILLEDLKKLKYLEKCIKETQRRFTSVPLMTRMATEDIMLSDKKVIPDGATVLLVYHAAHSDPKVFPDPDSWNPNHFDAEKSNNSFLPFGTGPRGCIGSKYALLSIKIQILYILYNYHLTTNVRMDDIILTLDVVLRNKFGYPIKISHRKHDNL